MKKRVFSYSGEFFATASDLARRLEINEVSLRSFITRNKITTGTFEYRNNTITIL